MVIQDGRMISYLDGTTKKPDINDPIYSICYVLTCEVKLTYLGLDNSTQLLNLNISRHAQRSDRNLFDEYGMDTVWKNIVKLLTSNKHAFLAGLNKKLDEVRDFLLGIKPLSSIG